MAEFTFFTNPMSRGQIARWALHEAGADYEQMLVDWQDKPAALIAANPMAKVPTVIHHRPSGDQTVSEAAAICAYLAETHPQADLLPREDERAPYLRWMLFVAGPVEQAITAKNLGFDPADDPQKQGMVGFGSYDRVMNTLEWWLKDREYVCGARFTMADVYVGSMVDWGLNFGLIPPRPAFVAYAERLQQREGYKAAKAVDNELIERTKK